ncbi:MAG: Rnf-Nqr domain containing protein [Rhodanobacteraceae bacterium]|nr:electron transport complex subunit RsxA [Pseudomonadota bacterium]
MATFILILLGAALANNAVLMHLLGVDPSIRSQDHLRDAVIIAAATGCVLLIAAIACWSIERFVLVSFRAEWLRPLAWLLVATALAPLPRAIVQRHFSPTPQQSSRALSPTLLLGNGLLLGVVALNGKVEDGFVAMLARSFGAAIGFAIVLLLFTAARDRLDAADVPAPFRGAPILLITAAIMALAFMGFAGTGRP